MPRKAYIANLQQAVGGLAIAGITDVQIGGDDGEFTFSVKNEASGATMELSALIPDVSEYPSSHTCMLFASDKVPNKVAQALPDIADAAAGKTISQLLELVARKLQSTDRDGDTQMTDSQENYGSDYEEDDEEEDYSGDEYFPDDEVVAKPHYSKTETADPSDYAQPTAQFRHRIRADLLAAKSSGFKIGHHGSLMDGLGCYVSVSVRIAKLGISEEAMQAWQIEPTEYLILILHYPAGYKSVESLRSYDAATARRNIGMRVGVSNTYKPTMQEAVRAFTVLSKDEERRREASQGESQSQDASAGKGFRNSFISRPLNELLNERLVTLIDYRYMGMPWSGAEQYYTDHLGTNIENSDMMNDKYMEQEQLATAYPALVTADHIQEAASQQVTSFPLIAMQFVLRHFVRCTEFCLVCFCKLADDLEAIKPYVCDKPLCLYQYMSLGFGPSIEHEIIAQPKVVDLLISFCYASARQGGLKDFPTGLSLMVPPSNAFDAVEGTTPNSYPGYSSHAYAQAGQGPPASVVCPPTAQTSKMRFNASKLEMIFDNPTEPCPVRPGDWVIICTADYPIRPLHCRVVETTFFPTVKVSEPVIPVVGSDQSGAVLNPAYNAPNPTKPASIVPSTFTPATFYTYNQNFDELHEFSKRQAIYRLLECLPSVAELRLYLLRKAQSGLNTWVDRLSPAALGILRWIIASNRACIMQVDDADSKGKKGEERLYGMTGWTQFRFAMGAPDKERRFITAVRSTAERLMLKYPTLFAWHGSPLQNWHSIIREGLHFNHTAHGRAYGHGVYHSLDYNTSQGYCGYNYTATSAWPMSELKVNSAIALNEIVNAPKEFVSSTPHFVVAQLDWIQTRYLFVKGAQQDVNGAKDPMPLHVHEQDPAATPRGPSDKIIIPINAVSHSRRPRSVSIKTTSKRIKTSGKNISDPIVLDDDIDDSASVATLEEDLAILCDDDLPVQVPEQEAQPYVGKGKGKASSFFSKLVGKDSKPAKPLTDFVAGSLDTSKLPMLEPPAWATTSATKRLQQDFKLLLKVQDTEPLHELGWYIDPNLISNMYQWIVELHSFDQTLPLAKDMKQKGIKSIVMELRFGKDYPMSPPFVRVIRPRFLGFQAGGGGHVTIGGALCMEVYAPLPLLCRPSLLSSNANSSKLLTNSGWSAVSSIESVLLQVRMAMSSLDPKPARLEYGAVRDYGVGEAVEAYIRACNTHGWTVPDGFREMAYGGQSQSGPGIW
jgi:ubiquitin-conjugating enzyme E2 Q